MDQNKDQNQSKEAIKIEARYKNAMDTGLALLNGKAFAPVSKIESSEIASVIDDFFKEEIEEKKNEFKSKFKQILKDKVEMDKFFKQKQAEFDKAILMKKKEFATKVEGVVSIVKGIDDMKKEYLASLSTDEEKES